MSSGAYKIIRNSNCIILPSDRTLRDYTHYINNKPGFSVEVDKQLAEEMNLESLEEHDKYVCIVADEIKIKEGIVFNKSTSDIVGFTEFVDINNSIQILQNDLINGTTNNNIATKVFVIMIRGLTTKINFPYATFPSCDLKGEEIAPLMMEATFRLEKIGIKVLAHTLDGCSINRKYFKMMSTETSIPYRTVNPFTTENRHTV